MTVPQFFSCEGGAEGVTPAVTDGGSGDALGVVTPGPNSILQYASVAAGHGGLGIMCANHSVTSEINTFGQLDPGGGIASFFGSFTYRCPNTPTGSTRVAQYRKNGGLIACSIWHSNADKLQLRHASDAAAATMVTSMVPGTKYRVEVNVVVNGTVNATLRIRLFLMDSNTLIEDTGDVAVTASGGITVVDLVRYSGGVTGQASWPDATTGYQAFDDLKAFYPSIATLISNVPVSGSSLASGILWGVRATDTLYAGAHYALSGSNDAPWCQADHEPTAFSLFAQHAGKIPPSIHWGGSAAGISVFDTVAEARTRLLGCFSMYTTSVNAGQLQDLLNNVDTNGGLTAWDALVNAIKTSGKPVLFRGPWEMNGNWGYAWQTAQGITAAQFKIIWGRMWQRAADIMGGHAAGSGLGTDTGNMSFFWCPNVKSTVPDPTPWAPPASQVDVPGVDFYNKGGAGDSPSFLADETLNILRALYPGKPLAIGETGCEAPTAYPGGKAQWITDFFAWLKSNPDIKYFNWFNETGSPSEPYIEEGNAAGAFEAEAQTAWAAGVADPYFIAGGTALVTDANFPVGQKVPTLGGGATGGGGPGGSGDVGGHASGGAIKRRRRRLRIWN